MYCTRGEMKLGQSQDVLTSKITFLELSFKKKKGLFKRIFIILHYSHCSVLCMGGGEIWRLKIW